MGLAVRLHPEALLVDYDATGRLVIPDGLCRTAPLHLVSLPDAPQGDTEEAEGDDTSPAAAPVVGHLDADGGDQSRDGAAKAADPGMPARSLLFVVDGVGQGQVPALLQALGLTDTQAEQEEARARSQAQEAAAAIDNMLRREGVAFVHGSAVLSATGRSAVDKVAAVLKPYPSMRVGVHVHTGCGASSGCARAAACRQFELARQRAAAVIDALRAQVADAHHLVAAPHGCKHSAVGARRLVRIMPEPVVRRDKGGGGGGVKDMQRVRMEQLRKVARRLLDDAASSGLDLRVGVVCATDALVDEDVAEDVAEADHVLTHDEGAEHGLDAGLWLQGASALVTLPPLGAKEARQVAFARAHAAASSLGNGVLGLRAGSAAPAPRLASLPVHSQLSAARPS
jgi:outer membrane protein OmpA-like peptidoglycan-associated protein